MIDENLIKEKYDELKFLDEQLRIIEEKIDEVITQEENILVTKEAISGFSELKEGDEMLVPLSNGIFVKSIIKENNNFLVNVGSEVVVEKSAEETLKLLKKQLSDIEKYKLELITKHQELLVNMQSMQDMVRKEFQI